MLLMEWDTEEAKVVWREEGFEDGFDEGLAKGREEMSMEVARNALAEGFSIETVHKITGIDIKFIQNIQAERI